MNAMKEAFETAGYGQHRLYSLAQEMLALADVAACHRMIEQVAADKRGESLPGGGQSVTVPQLVAASSRQSIEGVGGQVSVEYHPENAPSPSSKHDGGGQRQTAPHSVPAPSVVSRPAAPSHLVPVISHIRGKPRGAEAMALIQGTLKSALDRIKVRDGRSIGDVQWHELGKLAGENDREATLLRKIRGFAANVDPFAKVRDIVPEKYLEDLFAAAA